MRLLVGDHVGRDAALAEPHALGNSRSMPNVWPPRRSRRRPCRPSRSRRRSRRRSPRRRPRSWRRDDLLLADLLRRERMCSTTCSTAISMPFFRLSRFTLAATFFRPGERSPGRASVVVAPSPARRWSRRDSAHRAARLVLEDVLTSISSDGHAVVRDRGGAELLVEDDVGRARLSVTDGVRHRIDAELERLARLDVVLQSLEPCVKVSLADLGEDIGLAQDQQVLAAHDLRAAVLRAGTSSRPRPRRAERACRCRRASVADREDLVSAASLAVSGRRDAGSSRRPPTALTISRSPRA